MASVSKPQVSVAPATRRRSELAKGIFGFHRRTAGSVTLDGKALPSGDTAAAIEAGLGFAPEDRKEEALLLMQSILDNAVLCIPELVSDAGFYNRGKARGIIGSIADRLSIKAPSLDTPVSSLSGGNQQKVVLARWLARKPKVLILDEPTRGIDVGAKSEIYQTIRALTGTGLGVIVISSEMPELLGICDRICGHQLISKGTSIPVGSSGPGITLIFELHIAG